MFEARIRSGLILKNIIFAIKNTFPLTKWKCTSEGVSVYSMDSTKTSVLKLRFTKEAFDKYRCDHDLSFGVNTSSLKKILKYVTSEDMITISSGHRRDKIEILIEPSLSYSSAEVEFTKFYLNLIDYDITEVDVEQEGNPEFTKCASIRMPSSKFQRICHDLSQVGDRMVISCGEEIVRFHTSGEIGTGCVYLWPTFFADEPQNEVKFYIKEKCSLTFGLKQLNQFTKATPLTPQVFLNMRPIGPLEVNYEIIDTKINPNFVPIDKTVAVLRFFLSPNVDIED